MLTCEKSAITDVFTDHLLVRRGLKEWGAASAVMRTTGPMVAALACISRGWGYHVAPLGTVYYRGGGGGGGVGGWGLRY